MRKVNLIFEVQTAFFVIVKGRRVSGLRGSWDLEIGRLGSHLPFVCSVEILVGRHCEEVDSGKEEV
jgi:hypothetical protein